MDERWPIRIERGLAARRPAGPREEVRRLPRAAASFREEFERLFEAHFERLHRVMNRLSGEPELAADLIQEAFVRLYKRRSLPDDPAAWIITVAMNLFRNERGKRSRRLRLLTPERAERSMGDPPASPDEAVMSAADRRAVRAALDRLPERDRMMLLLQMEGYRYGEIAAALSLNERSVGTLLARARRGFRRAYEETSRASR